MCGFVGFTQSSRQLDSSTIIRDMANSITHRGPDDEGFYIDESVALGFRRLSIVDLKNGKQPMTNADESLVLCFNGEIYNYRELRDILIRAGHTFSTNSDTEVLLHAYEEWGENMLDRLRGMFAFVIYNRLDASLFFARDPFGIKPLYYYENRPHNVLLFASESKAFLKHPLFEKRLRSDLLPTYLCFEYIPSNETLFDGVQRLQAGHRATWKNGKLVIHRYFQPSYQIDESLTLDDWAECIGSTISESCRAHSIADVEVGCFLSAGVDSSLVATEARDISNARTFSIGYAEQRYSELDAAKELARAVDIRNESCTITAQDFFDSASSIQYFMDEPLPNPSAVPLFHLARFASENVKVVMSGEGADELFGGYTYYQECLSFESYMHIPRTLRLLAGSIASAMPPFHGRRFLMRGQHTLPERYIRNNYVYNFNECDSVLQESITCPKPARYTSQVFAECEGLDEVTRMQYADMLVWMQYDILQKADKMSMAASLELRVPFLDKNVLDVALRIPARYRVSKTETKIALRRAARAKLPEKTAAMPKIGFITPLNMWLRQEQYAKYVREAFNSETARMFFHVDILNTLLDNHISGKEFNMKKIWSIYSFLLWYDEYFIKR